MLDYLNIFITNEEGQALVEYSLIILFIAIALIGVLSAFGAQITTTYTNIGDDFPTI